MGDLWPQAVNDGAIIRVPDLAAPLGGRIVAVVTTFIEPLVKPHDCNRHRRYSPDEAQSNTSTNAGNVSRLSSRLSPPSLKWYWLLAL